MSGRFGDAFDNFIIVAVAVAIVLLLAVMFGARQSPLRAVLRKILVQNPHAVRHQTPEFNRQYYITGERPPRHAPHGNNQPHSVMATLVQKVDERRRTIDPGGTAKLYNEYYELIFRTRDNYILHLVTSKRVYMEIPFSQLGKLTFQGDGLVQFQYPGGEIVENPQELRGGSPGNPKRR